MLSQQPRYQRPSSRHLISCLSRQKSLGLRLEPQDRDIPILGYLKENERQKKNSNYLLLICVSSSSLDA